VTWDGDLYALFKRFRPFRASDPRDKVYALLGIAASAEQIPILPPVYYELDILSVMWNLIDAHISNNGMLDFLSDGCGVKRPDGFPSWMPLWYEPADLMSSRPLKSFEFEPHILYRAGRHTKAYVRGNMERKSITLYGGRLTVIESTTDAYDMSSDANDGRRNLFKIFQHSAELMGVADTPDAAYPPKRMSFEEEAAYYKQYMSTITPEEHDLFESFQALRTLSVRYMTTNEFHQVSPDSTEFLAIRTTVDEEISSLDISRSLILGRFVQSWHGRRFFKSKDTDGKPWFGLCPAEAQAGDEIACFIGADVMFVIRKQEDVGGEAAFWVSR
jgi:hypothetical protein